MKIFWVGQCLGLIGARPTIGNRNNCDDKVWQPLGNQPEDGFEVMAEIVNPQRIGFSHQAAATVSTAWLFDGTIPEGKGCDIRPLQPV